MKSLTEKFEEIIEQHNKNVQLGDHHFDSDIVSQLTSAVKDYNQAVVGEDIPVDCSWTKDRDGMPNGCAPCNSCVNQQKINSAREYIRQRQEELI